MIVGVGDDGACDSEEGDNGGEEEGEECPHACDEI